MTIRGGKWLVITIRVEVGVRNRQVFCERMSGGWCTRGRGVTERRRWMERRKVAGGLAYIMRSHVS